MDIVGLSLGVRAGERGSEELYMSKIIERNTTIPVEKTKTFLARNDN